MAMNRTPPVAVRRQLRQEVGFGCPVPGCGNPYLTWHHFDPPWSVREHHEPNGMIALCRQHHDQADAGAYTSEQIRRFKEEAILHEREIRGRFEWMRRDLMVVAGGNFFYRPRYIVNLNGKSFLWCGRDQYNHLLMNLSMPDEHKSPGMVIQENYWTLEGKPKDVECPPSGKFIKVEYPNGDLFEINFLEMSNYDEIMQRYSNINVSMWKYSGIQAPMTCAEVKMNVSRGKIAL